MKPTVIINGTTVTFSSLTIRQAYNLDDQPEMSAEQQQLYLAFESDYPLVLLSAGCEPSLLLDGNEIEILEAFRKANPFVEKPLFKELRAMKNEVIGKHFSARSASLSETAMPEPGITP